MYKKSAQKKWADFLYKNKTCRERPPVIPGKR